MYSAQETPALHKTMSETIDKIRADDIAMANTMFYAALFAVRILNAAMMDGAIPVDSALRSSDLDTLIAQVNAAAWGRGINTYE